MKGFIAVHVDGKEKVVEQIYQIALESSEFDDSDDEAEPTTSEKNVPMYQEFSLATDDEDSEDRQEMPENNAQAALF